jgi:hypothetical protein
MDTQSMETHFEALELGQKQLTKVSNKLEKVLLEFTSWLLPIKQELANSAAEVPPISTLASAPTLAKLWKMKPSLLTEFNGNCMKG